MLSSLNGENANSSLLTAVKLHFHFHLYVNRESRGKERDWEEREGNAVFQSFFFLCAFP